MRKWLNFSHYTIRIDLAPASESWAKRSAGSTGAGEQLVRGIADLPTKGRRSVAGYTEGRPLQFVAILAQYR